MSNGSVTVRLLSIEKSVSVAVDGNVLIEAVSNGSVTVRLLSIEKSVSVAVDQKRIDRGSEQWFRYSSPAFHRKICKCCS